MPGFCFILSKNELPERFEYDYNALNKLNIKEIKIGKNIFLSRFTNNKFLNDKIFYDNEKISIVTDGIILNSSDLKKQYKAENLTECFKRMYSSRNIDFINELRGEFSGLIYDKLKNKCYVFNNPTGSKPLFYYQNSDLIVFASEMRLIHFILTQLKKKCNLDRIGAYFMLTYGIMLDNITLIDEIKRLRPGSLACVHDNKLSISRYHLFDNQPDYSISQKDAIEGFDFYFLRALNMEYNKDKEYDYNYLSTLSGGLDSRSNVMIAHELGYKDITNINVSYPGTPDHKIAERISRYFNDKFIFSPLINGDYLLELERNFLANDGLVYYSGCAHLLKLFRNLNISSFGSVHSGTLGETIMGIFIKNPYHVNPGFSKPSSSYSELFDKIHSFLNDIYDKYPNQELFTLYNREMNGIFNHYWSLSHFTESVSPFCDTDLIDFTLKIPPHFKVKAKLQVDWLQSKHPLLTRFITERYLSRPTNKYFRLNTNLHFMKLVFTRIMGSHIPISMVPFEYWYRNNQKLNVFYNEYFDDNIELLSGFKELQSDTINHFYSGNFIKKSQVLTLLKAIDYYHLI